MSFSISSEIKTINKRILSVQDGTGDISANALVVNSGSINGELAVDTVVTGDMEIAGDFSFGTVFNENYVLTDVLGDGNVTWAASASEIDTSVSYTWAADQTFSSNVIIEGDMTVNGTTTSFDDISVEDKDITLGATTTPTDETADGGGIILKGDTDKTILWKSESDAWEFSEDIRLNRTEGCNIYMYAAASYPNTIGFYEDATELFRITSFTSGTMDIKNPTSGLGINIGGADGNLVVDGALTVSSNFIEMGLTTTANAELLIKSVGNNKIGFSGTSENYELLHNNANFGMYVDGTSTGIYIDTSAKTTATNNLDVLNATGDPVLTIGDGTNGTDAILSISAASGENQVNLGTDFTVSGSSTEFYIQEHTSDEKVTFDTAGVFTVNNLRILGSGTNTAVGQVLISNSISGLGTVEWADQSLQTYASTSIDVVDGNSAIAFANSPSLGVIGFDAGVTVANTPQISITGIAGNFTNDIVFITVTGGQSDKIHLTPVSSSSGGSFILTITADLTAACVVNWHVKFCGNGSTVTPT